MEDWKFCRFVSEVTYAATASNTGISITLYGGTGVLVAAPSGSFPQVFWGATIPAQPNAHYGDNGVAITLSTVTPSQASPTTTKTSFYFDFPQIRLPGLVRLKFSNLDATNPAVVALFADVS